MNQHYSLSQLNKSIGDALRSLESSYWVIAEIGELRVHQNGHCYLDLIEKNGSRIIAKSRATIWSYTYSTISRAFEKQTGSPLAVGMNILVNASIQYHEIYGLSLNINDIDPNFTIGERHRRKQEVIKKLDQQGLLNKNNQLALPVVPQRIAVISSASAAGLDDFQHQIAGNPYNYQVNWQLFDVVLQGDTSIASILSQISTIHKRSEQFDLLIIIRGGGAQTDFDTFDDYEICSAIAKMPIPVITGIGHERDTTIADFVAHTSMKTPTAVAEFIITGMLNFETSILNTFEKISSFALKTIQAKKDILSEINNAIAQLGRKKIHESTIELNDLDNSMISQAYRFIQSQKDKIELLSHKAKSYDPTQILERGYSITRMDGKLINGTSPSKGDTIETTTRKYTFKSTVD